MIPWTLRAGGSQELVKPRREPEGQPWRSFRNPITHFWPSAPWSICRNAGAHAGFSQTSSQSGIHSASSSRCAPSRNTTPGQREKCIKPTNKAQSDGPPPRQPEVIGFSLWMRPTASPPAPTGRVPEPASSTASPAVPALRLHTGGPLHLPSLHVPNSFRIHLSWGRGVGVSKRGCGFQHCHFPCLTFLSFSVSNWKIPTSRLNDSTYTETGME